MAYVRTVRREWPSECGQSQTTYQRFAGQGLLQLTDLARATHALKLAGVGEDGHAGAVVATVFKALEAFDQNGGNVTFGDCANNSTHGASPR